MKRLIALIMTGIIMLFCAACGGTDKETAISKNQTENMTTSPVSTPIDRSDYEILSDYLTTSCSKDNMDELLPIFYDDPDSAPDKDCWYNVTPPCVAFQSDIQIFKYRDTCLSIALVDGKAYSICQSFGGFGFVNGVLWDYDEDGNLDLLLASSWGSGMHRSEISVFNTTTKESSVIFDTFELDDPSVDLVVVPSAPALTSKEDNNITLVYDIYIADLEVKNDNLADLSYTPTHFIGTIENNDGVLVFVGVDN